MPTSIPLHRLLALPPSIRRSFFSTTSATSIKPESIYDIVCVGGGPAGLSLISALQSHPATSALKIALIDSQDLSSARPAPSPDVYSNRCSSLTPSSLRFLRSIGAWNQVDTVRTQPYHAMDVWDGVSGSKIHFDSLDKQSTGLVDTIAEMVPGSRFQASRRKYESGGEDGMVASMCENNNLTSGLLQRMSELQNTESTKLKVLDKTKVESVQLGPEPETEESLDLSQWPVVTTNNGNQLAARLLVGADGANSPVRQFADIPSHGWDYIQQGVVATLHLDHSYSSGEPRTAYQRFLPTGPIALLPLPGNKASLVWSTTPAHAAKLKQLQPEDFVAIVNAAFRLMHVDVDYMLSSSATTSPSEEAAWREPATSPMQTGLPSSIPRVQFLQPGTVASFPLRLRHASTYTGHRVALIGDAAHTIHPLAGQGLNLGLGDSQSLFEHIVKGVENGMDVGSCWCLDGYNEDRWAKNNAVLGVVDKLQKIYGVGAGPVVWSRSLGVEVLDRLGGVKGLLMGAAAGGN